MSAAQPTNRLERFDDILQGFRDLRASSAGPRLSRMAAVVDKFASLVILRPPRFNSLKVLRVGANEVVHSGVLAWLLDASAGHGQGPRFLNLLAEALGLPISLGPKHRYLVRREFSGRESIVDVCVCRPGAFIIYLENKIWAGEGFEQIDREWRDLQRTAKQNHISDDRRFAVFLTPDGHPPISGDPSPWLCLSYAHLVRTFEAAVPGIKDIKTATFISDWLDTISQWGAES